MNNQKSRKKTRQCLLQALYSRVYLKNKFDKKDFLLSFFDEWYDTVLDIDYFDELFAWIIEREGELVFVIEKLAPKFDITIMSVVNLLPIFIASYEQLYFSLDKIPENVSINEALNLTKTFSDEKWRIFVNWVLNSLKDQKIKILDELKNINNKKVYFF